MLKLIWRQIIKNKNWLIPITMIWIVSGYFIFEYQHNWFGSLSRWWLDLPAAGVQNPEKAKTYYIRAIERLQENQTDLNLMNKACEEFLPITFIEDIEDYRPHWLEKLNNWESSKLETGNSLDSRTNEPDLYWLEHQPGLLASLKDILDALNYAWELKIENQNNSSKEIILLARVFASYARALCQPALGRMVWGDYAQFQEIRAWKKFQKEQAIGDYPVNQILRKKAIRQMLRDKQNYRLALREYIAGSPPLYGNYNQCARGPFRLSCSSPDEAIEVYRKLILVSPDNEHDILNLYLARTAWMKAQILKNNNEVLLEVADFHYHAALKSSFTEQEALFELATLEIEQQKYKAAWDHIKQLSLQKRRPGFPRNNFNKLARRILIANGRYREADCYAEMSSIQYGKREHCKNSVL